VEARDRQRGRLAQGPVAGDRLGGLPPRQLEDARRVVTAARLAQRREHPLTNRGEPGKAQRGEVDRGTVPLGGLLLRRGQQDVHGVNTFGWRSSLGSEG